jgi:predicted nuclease with RNAse H fold
VTFAGVDVGAARKGFHVAVLHHDTLVAGPRRVRAAHELVSLLRPLRPRLVAVDSPMALAPKGGRSRWCERALASAVCSLRYTPDFARVGANAYYAWIVNGLALYGALAEAGFDAIECFPTAAWTRWAGRRNGSRAEWSSRALMHLGVRGVPPRVGQDGRDAIAAALTARLHAEGRTESFGEIVVPR